MVCSLDDPDRTSSVLVAVVGGTIANPRTWLPSKGFYSAGNPDPSMRAAVAIVADNVAADVRAALKKAGGVSYVAGRPGSAAEVPRRQQGL